MGVRVRQGVSSGWSVLRDNLRSQFWPIPVLGVVIALVLGVEMPRVDARVDASLGPSLSGYLFGGDADAARSVLGTIASSLITVTSLTFSLTVVTLQLASSQFSPRLLRNFTSDAFVHTTLALFLGTFTYSLTVLRTVHGAGGSTTLFVPKISVTLAFVMTVLSVLGLVLFLAHLARQIRVETMLRNVHADASDTGQRVLPERSPAAHEGVTRPDDPDLVLASQSGFLLRVDEHELLAAAVEAGAVISVDRYPGSSLVEGTPVGSVWGTDGPLAVATLTTVQDRVARALLTGFERTSAQDIGYGLRQLVDVANKALSPGINDPTTAVHALGHASALLCEFATSDLTDQVMRDDAGRVRVLMARPSLADLLDLVMSQPRRYGAADPEVLARLFQLLRELAWTLTRVAVTVAGERQAVADQLGRLVSTVRDQGYDRATTDDLDALARGVGQALEGVWDADVDIR
jgi:uncharacterized membrane protein